MQRPNVRDLARGTLTTGAYQAAVQVLAFLAGIIILRVLSREEYAYYTIAITVVGAMNVLADCGLSSALLAIGGERWRDRYELGKVLATGFAIRKSLALVAFVVCGPVLALLLIRQGAPWIEAVCVSMAVIPATYWATKTQVLEIAPRLHQHVAQIQRIQFDVNLARLFIIGLAMTFAPFALVAILAGASYLPWSNRRLNVLASRDAELGEAQDELTRARLLQQLRRKAPEAIFYVLSGSITSWLISLFGSTDAVATVGALSRIAAIFSILTTIFQLVAISRFARIPEADIARIRRRFWQSQIILGCACLALFTAFWLAPQIISMVLGPKYSGQDDEALLMIAAGAIGAMLAAVHGLGAARGIIPPALLTIPFMLAVQSGLIAALPISTARGAILLGLLVNSSAWILNTGYVWLKFPTSSAKR